MPDLWYYGKNEQRIGPVPLKELQWLASSGDLDGTDLIWSPGMAEWTAASEVEGLFSATTSVVTSPPYPASSEAEAPVAEDRWHYEQEGERRSPVAFEELRRLAASGQLQPDNLVWKRDMAEWTPAGQVDGLFPVRTVPPDQPADKWYYGDGEERHGPVPFQELRHLAYSRQLCPDDLVWNRGMAEWTPAAQVEGLFPARTVPHDQPAELWYYGDGEQRHGPAPMRELKVLAFSGKLRPTDMVWKQGMAEWTPAAEVAGLFPVKLESRPRAETPAPQKPREPVVPKVPVPTVKEQVQYIRDSLSEASTATRTNLERSRKFIHRQHLGTRLRLLLTDIACGAVWCYNAIRPIVVRAWSKRPSKQEVRDWSAVKAQQASEAWKRTAPQRSHLTQRISVGLSHMGRGLVYCWHVTGRFAVWSWRHVRNLGAWFVRPLRSLRLSFKPKPRVGTNPSPKPKSVSATLRAPPPLPKPLAVTPASLPQSPVSAAVTPPAPELVTPAVLVPPPMPKPASPASRVPPPMPRVVRSAAPIPPPMPKPTLLTQEQVAKPPTSATSAPTSAESQSVHQPKGD